MSTPDLKDTMRKEQERRFALLQDGCKYFNMSLGDPVNYKHLLVNDVHKILFNFIPKVSCSTWKGVLKNLRAHNETGHPALNAYTEEEKATRMASYRKVLFVRDPMSRFLSAYMSKFRSVATRNKTGVQRLWEKLFGRDIVKRYRGITVEKVTDGEFLNITLIEFMNYVVDVGTNIKMTVINDHWLPQHIVSQPCQIKYDFIGHFENLAVEGPYVLKWLNVDHLVKFPEYHDSKAVQNLIEYYKIILITGTKIPMKNRHQKLPKFATIYSHL